MNEVSNSTSMAGLPSVLSESKFFQRQFDDDPTFLQGVFDWLFGIILPPLCFFFDPAVFRFWGDPLLGESRGVYSSFATFIYSLAVIAISCLLFWKLFGHRSKTAAGFLGIFFSVSAIISFALGFFMIPISLIGLMFFFLGLLGFIPFLSAFVYFRNGMRAMRFSGEI